MAKNNNMKTFKHKGKHITVNTISELEEAKIKSINLYNESR